MSETEPQLEHEVEVVTGEHVKGYLDEPTIREFMLNLRESTYDAPNIIGQGVRMKARQVLEPVADILKKKVVQKTLNMLHPGDSLQRETDNAVASFRESLEKGSAVLVLVDGEPAGVAVVEDYRYQMKDGSSISEIAKVSVLPRFAGKGVRGRLYTAAAEYIRENKPGTHTMSITKSGSMKRYFHNQGWNMVNGAQVNAMTNRSDVLRSKGMTEKDIEHLNRLWDEEKYVMAFAPQQQTAD